MKILVGNRTCRILNSKYAYRLRKHFTFVKPQYEDARIKQRWHSQCLIETNGEFPTGLLPTVCEILGDAVKIKFIDERINQFTFGDLDISYLLKHQKKAPKTITNNKVRGLPFPSGVWWSATNSGKTYISTPMIKYCVDNDIPTLLLIHNEEIYDNHIEHYTEMGIDVGEIRSDLTEIKCFTIAMYKTLFNRYKSSVNIKRYLNGIHFLIADECHRVGAKDYANLLRKIPSYSTLFMSGTAERSDILSTMVMHSLSGQHVFKLSNKKMDKLKQSTKCVVRIFTNKTQSPSTLYKHKLTYCIHEAKFRLKTLKRETKDCKKVLVGVRRVAHAEFLHKHLKGSEVLLGTDKKHKKDIINRFKTGETKYLITTILREGVNIKGIDFLAVMMGGKSKNELIQLIGRARRLSGLKHFVLLDFIDRAFYEDGMFRISLYIKEGFEIKKINK